MSSLYPRRAPSLRRCVACVTGRISPARLSSPIAAMPCGIAILATEPATASAIARSAAGSVNRTPPTVET